VKFLDVVTFYRIAGKMLEAGGWGLELVSKQNQDRRRCALHPPHFLFIPPKRDGVAKSPPYGVMAFFRTSTCRMYAFAPEKTPSLVGRNFCLAIP